MKREYEGQRPLGAPGTALQFMVKHVLYDEQSLRGCGGSPVGGGSDGQPCRSAASRNVSASAASASISRC